MLTCQKCGRQYEYGRNKGHTRLKCNSCMTNGGKEYKKQVLYARHGNKCIKCGYDKVAALCFHHLNSKHKTFNISGNHGLKLETLILESDKCIHEFHAGYWVIEDLLNYQI